MLIDRRRPLLAVDIETVTQGKQASDYTDREKIKAPSNYKSQDAIDRYIEAEREKRASKHGLSWHTGKVLSVAWENIQTGEQGFFWSMDEAEVLQVVSDKWGQANLIGKSSLDFDFPFLRGRYMASSLAIPAVLKDRNRLYDCDDFLSFSKSCGQRGKLDAYAHALGMELKSMDGSHVGELYDRICLNNDQDAIKELEEYNKYDAHIVAEMTRRYIYES